MRRRLLYGAAAVALLAIAFAACSGTSAFTYREVTVTTFGHDSFHALLKRHVAADGTVDYAAWHKNADDRRALQDYVNLIGNASPESHPQLFPDNPSRMTYWINAYNALVIEAVLSHYPVKSVNDIRPGVNFVRGQGFFYNLKFKVGGRSINLYDLENKILREQFKDPRIHFAINCASGSCPPLQSEAFSGPILDKQLDDAARKFINDDRDVYVSHAKKTVFLSKIFEWYASDFGDVKTTLRRYADPKLIAELDKAGDYAIGYLDYDWNLNER